MSRSLASQIVQIEHNVNSTLEHVHRRLHPFHLEGLVAHKDVSIQGEAELTALEETSICLGMAAVWAEAATLGVGKRLRNGHSKSQGQAIGWAHHSHRQAIHTFPDRERYCLHVQDRGQTLRSRQLYC